MHKPHPSVLQLFVRSLRACRGLVRHAIPIWVLAPVVVVVTSLPGFFASSIVGRLQEGTSGPDSLPTAEGIAEAPPQGAEAVISPSGSGCWPSGASGATGWTVCWGGHAPPVEPLADNSSGLSLQERVRVQATIFSIDFHLPPQAIWLVGLQAVLLLGFGVPPLRFFMEQLAQAGRQRIKRALQRRVIRSLVLQASDGTVLESGRVQHALDTAAEIVAGVLTQRVKDWLLVLLTMLQTLGVLLSQNLAMAVFIGAWGLFVTFVLPLLPFFKGRGDAAGGSAATAVGSRERLALGGSGSAVPEGADIALGAADVKAPAASAGIRSLRQALGHAQMESGVKWQTLKTEIAVGLPTIVSLHAGPTFEDEVDELSAHRDALTLESARLNMISDAMSGLTQSSGIGALLFGVASGLDVRTLINVYNNATQFVVGVQRGGHAYGVDVESASLLAEGLSHVERGRDTPHAVVLDTPPRISFHGLTLAVPQDGGGRPVALLSDFSLVVEPGSTVKIVGPSGSGKSSLLRLLSGQITVGGGSVLVGERRFDAGQRVSVLRSATVVTQFSQLFSRSSRENVLLGCSKPVMSVEEAARMACLDEDVRTKPLERENAQTLSGGERKRLMLARAFVRPVLPLVLLDEVDSGLGEAGARRVYQNIRTWVSGRATCFIVTHQPDVFDADITLRFDGRGGVEIEHATV